MKTKFTLTILFLSIFCVINAQQQPPNAGLDTWTNANAPDSWTDIEQIYNQSTNIFTFRDSVDKVQGTASAKILVDTIPGHASRGAQKGFISVGTGSVGGSGVVFQGVPFTSRPDTLIFSYKYTSPGSDTAIMYFRADRNSVDVVAYSSPLLLSPSWTLVSVPLDSFYHLSGNPDTLELIFFASMAQSPVIGSTLHVDGIRLGYALATAADAIAADVSLKVFPNPASTAISVLSAKMPEGTDFQLFDATGRLIMQQRLAETLATMDVSALSSGLYFYHAKDNTGFVVGQGKVVIAK